LKSYSIRVFWVPLWAVPTLVEETMDLGGIDMEISFYLNQSGRLLGLAYMKGADTLLCFNKKQT
jgi:hypothetical protein